LEYRIKSIQETLCLEFLFEGHMRSVQSCAALTPIIGKRKKKAGKVWGDGSNISGVYRNNAMGELRVTQDNLVVLIALKKLGVTL
jgi:hypothetical protein